MNKKVVFLLIKYFKMRILIFLSLFPAILFSQLDSGATLKVQGYGEFYYGHNFENKIGHEDYDFIYNHRRNNEFNINLALLKVSYSQANIRANVATMIGNYAQYNLASEPTWAQFIYEANMGIKLSKSNLWLDVGIMPSHLGYESAISMDCSNLTRSIMAENSPYYETGARVSYTSKNENFYASFLVLNGWQKVAKLTHVQLPSIGAQIWFKPSANVLINYSNFIGQEKPDSFNSIRIFHNFYSTIDFSKKLSGTLGFDIGMDKYSPNNNGWWHAGSIVARYSLSDKSKIGVRAEYYDDPHQIIINTGTSNGFRTWGLSTNFDYYILKNVLFRSEFKMFQSKDMIFYNNNDMSYSWTSSLAIKL